MAAPSTTSASRPASTGPRAVVLTAVVVLVFVEVLLRTLFGFGNPRIVETDARLGYRFYPGQTIPGPRGTTERINAAGYRDREWGLPAKEEAGRPRGIAVLGASVPYGTGVEGDRAWPQLLEHDLAPGHDVLNLALPGYVLGQFAPQYEDDVRPLRPAIVILELSPHSIRRAPVRTDSARYPLHTFVRRSAIHDAMSRRSDMAGAAERAVLAHRDPEEETDPELWREAEVRMDALAASMRSDGVQLVLLETPLLGAVLALESKAQAATRRWDTWAARHPEVVHLRTSPALRTEMASVLAELERLELDPSSVWTRTTEPLVLEHAADNLFFQDDPLHLNERGHRAVARIVLEGLRAAELL